MDRKIQQILNLALCLCIVLAACNKDRQNAQPVITGSNGQSPIPNTGDDRLLYIACEGSFGSGNASLSMQNLTSGTGFDDVYLTTNNKSIGDVLQSIQRIDDKLFLCVNNSDNVLVINAKTRQFIKRIDIPKPRYIMPVDPHKAYVSTLYSNKLYVIDPTDLNITGTIDMPALNPERMTKQGNRVYVCTWDTACNKIYSISTVTDQLLDSQTIAGFAPHSVVTDAVGFVWVLSGNPQQGKKAALTKLEPGITDVVESFNFQSLQDPIKMITDKAKNNLYFIGVDYNGLSGYNGIFKMGTTDGKLPSVPLIPAQKFQYFWGLGTDPVTDDIYVGDPKGFTQKGSVSVYSSTGEQLRSFGTGVGPGYFYFDE